MKLYQPQLISLSVFFKKHLSFFNFTLAPSDTLPLVWRREMKWNEESRVLCFWKVIFDTLDDGRRKEKLNNVIFEWNWWILNWTTLAGWARKRAPMYRKQITFATDFVGIMQEAYSLSSINLYQNIQFMFPCAIWRGALFACLRNSCSSWRRLKESMI